MPWGTEGAELLRQVDWIRFTEHASPSAGCSTWSKDDLLSHSRPHHGSRRRCIGKAGMMSHAVCCHAPALECHLVEKTSADEEEVDIAHFLKKQKKPKTTWVIYDAMSPYVLQVELSCLSGWTMTDCSAIHQGAALLGPGAEGSICRVRRLTGAGVAAGVAVCCRVTPQEGGDTSAY